ncbi:hypothetical protein HOT75_gp082 [Gordonia phage Daredevil]|uniref:Uncharacterized protein n=1 Tax=Gordonia phage Daredevil TaxID=2283286 RepID=A0A345MIT8_9CAUD|nr:hypothetical protein HOT75_gp082 [Gordonia phage Daredevil]AXH70469.1 hypothetical protein SEA_DAREDEVIL_82 [Gordonia phage Daredevil]
MEHAVIFTTHPTSEDIVLGPNAKLAELLAEHPSLREKIADPTAEVRYEYSVQLPDGELVSSTRLRAATTPADRFWTGDPAEAEDVLEQLIEIAAGIGVRGYDAKLVRRVLRISYSAAEEV